MKAAYYSTSSSSPKGKNKNLIFFFLKLVTGVVVVATGFLFLFYSIEAELLLETLGQWIAVLVQYLYEVLFRRERCAPLGGMEQESPSRSAEETSPAGNLVHMMRPDNQGRDLDLNIVPIVNVPPFDLNQPPQPEQGNGIMTRQAPLLDPAGPSQPSSSTQQAGRPASDSGPSENPEFDAVERRKRIDAIQKSASNQYRHYLKRNEFFRSIYALNHEAEHKIAELTPYMLDDLDLNGLSLSELDQFKEDIRDPNKLLPVYRSLLKLFKSREKYGDEW